MGGPDRKEMLANMGCRAGVQVNGDPKVIQGNLAFQAHQETKAIGALMVPLAHQVKSELKAPKGKSVTSSNNPGLLSQQLGRTPG